MNYDNLDLSKNYKEKKTNHTPRTVLAGDAVLEHPPQISCIDPLVTLYGENGNFCISKATLSRPLILIGASGYGKTNALMQICDSLLKNVSEDDLVVFFDARGDYKKRYFRHGCSTDILLSPLDEDEQVTKGWSIFGELFHQDGSFKHAKIIATQIADHLFEHLEGTAQPFFSQAASELFASLLTAFALRAKDSGDYASLNNESFLSFLSTASVPQMYALVEPYPSLHGIKNYLGDGNSPQALGVLGFVQACTKSFIGPFARSKMPGGQFSIRRVVRERKVSRMFVKFDITLADTFSLYSVLYDLLINESIACKNRKVYLITDEFNLLTSKAIETALNFGRGSGTHLVLSLQGIPQLRKNYNHATASSMVAGFVNQIVFRCVDAESREYVCKNSGKIFEVIDYGSANLTRESTCIEDTDLNHLQIGEAFVSLADTPVFKFKFRKTDTDTGDSIYE